MTFPRPTLGTLRDLARSEVAARLPGADPALRRSVVMVLAEAMAGLAHHQYGYLDFIARQVIPDTAGGEYLDRWCRMFGLQRKPATAAGGSVTFTGTDGTPIALGTRLTRGDGVTYATTQAGTIAAGTATIAAAAEAAGEGGNVVAGAALTLMTAIPGLLGTVTVAAGGLTGGGGEEADAPLRERLRSRMGTPPAGGAAHDYVAWALAVPGVTRAWVFPLARGAGTVDVAFVMDGRVNIIPTAGDVADVQAAVDAQRPVTADVLVYAPVAAPLAITITGLTPDNAAIRAAVEAELAAAIRRDSAPGGTIRRSRLIEAISRAAGESHHTLTIPAADVTHAVGQIPVLGTVTYA
jgi:uncharacterized phage protein gp47/JayE